MCEYAALNAALHNIEKKKKKKKCYKGVKFNIISVTRGWMGVKFPVKKRYVTLEWPLTLE